MNDPTENYYLSRVDQSGLKDDGLTVEDILNRAEPDHDEIWKARAS